MSALLLVDKTEKDVIICLSVCLLVLRGLGVFSHLSYEDRLFIINILNSAEQVGELTLTIQFIWFWAFLCLVLDMLM